MMLIIHQPVWPWLWLIWFDCLIYNVHRWRLSLASALLASGTISSSPNLINSSTFTAVNFDSQDPCQQASVLFTQVPSHLSGSLFHPRWSRQFGCHCPNGVDESIKTARSQPKKWTFFSGVNPAPVEELFKPVVKGPIRARSADGSEPMTWFTKKIHPFEWVVVVRLEMLISISFQWKLRPW